MIGIGGIARSGKDTLARNLLEIIERDLGANVQIFSFAHELKRKINPFLKQEFGISAFSDNTEDKKIIRPILVSYGESMKAFYGENVWYSHLMNHIKITLGNDKIFPIVSDVRFDFEANAIKENEGKVIHISKTGNQPANEIEALNDPLVLGIADLSHTWPPYQSGSIGECKSHAEIIWQMIDEGSKEKWKKIYS